jgi:prevent-host-death family protein
MEKVVSSTELQKRTRDVIDLARTQDMAIVVETYGKPMVVILPYDEYQEYMAFKQRQQEARRARFAELRQMADQQSEAGATLSDVEAQDLVDAAREQVYQQRQAQAEQS